MNVAAAVGRALVDAGIDHVFGVVGSGNFHITTSMVAAGATFVAARHEGGAATMADGYARMSGTVSGVTVHQGCGLTNAMTGLTEAAKSRTPMVVIAAEATVPTSNFAVDQEALATAVGAMPVRIDSAATAVAEAHAAVALARDARRTVLLNLPLDVQADDYPGGGGPADRRGSPGPVGPTEPSGGPRVATDAAVAALVDALRSAHRPVFVAGRGARGPRGRAALERLADAAGALVATSAVAKGLFQGSPWSLDVSGGFSSPLAAELIREADLIVGWGCALNMWTMRHGRLIGEDTTVIQVDDDPEAIGVHRPGAIGVVGDVRATADAALAAIGGQRDGYRSDALRDRIAREIRWRDVPLDDTSSTDRVDPRVLTIALDDLLPGERVVGVDSGNFMGYPSMFLSVPDQNGFCFTQAYQSIGLGLATTIGAALAQPSRLPVAALGDGGALMSVAEFDTVVRLGLPMVVIVYNDDAYGAEVHHFGPSGHPLDTVEFPPTDIASIARGFGFEALTVRGVEDLAPVEGWVSRWRAGRESGEIPPPLLVDAKITSTASWWLEEAFRGH